MTDQQERPESLGARFFGPFGAFSGLAFLFVFVGVNPAFGHFSILLPSAPSAKKGDQIVVLYQWGHPFEHQIFDAPPPNAVIVNAPIPAPRYMTPNLREEAIDEGGKKVRGYRLKYTLEHRRDYIFVAQSPPIWMDADNEFYQDTAKVIVHVQGGKGWDESFSDPLELEMVPLIRPYGLQPGMVFQARALKDRKPLSDALVEIEHYNSTPPKELPADEHITRTAKTDPNGIVTCTLTDPGWWCIAGQCGSGTAMRDGKPFPVRKRAILWVYVDEKVAANSSK
jgi:cobalt/nickel transport protein